MKQIYHFSDQLGSVDCIPCPEKNHSGRYNRDHIPTKALLNRPYPENLMPVGMCKECNSRFAKDEEYFSAFIAAVISGSAKPDPLQFPTAFRILARNPRLRSRIDAARRIEATPGKEPVVIWTPECQGRRESGTPLRHRGGPGAADGTEATGRAVADHGRSLRRYLSQPPGGSMGSGAVCPALAEGPGHPSHLHGGQHTPTGRLHSL